MLLKCLHTETCEKHIVYQEFEIDVAECTLLCGDSGFTGSDARIVSYKWMTWSFVRLFSRDLWKPVVYITVWGVQNQCGWMCTAITAPIWAFWFVWTILESLSAPGRPSLILHGLNIVSNGLSASSTRAYNKGH